MIKSCVIGWPISHSRSPLIHGYWLKQHGIDGSYTRQPVEPVALACASCHGGFEVDIDLAACRAPGCEDEAAVAAGELPTDWKPRTCNRVPIRVEEQRHDGGTIVTVPASQAAGTYYNLGGVDYSGFLKVATTSTNDVTVFHSPTVPDYATA